jgi:hypothetical protein
VYVARIGYEYEMNGTRHQGSMVCIGGEMNTSGKGRAEERCRRYPLGARVEVFHDPQRTERCCLERTREGAWLWYLGNRFLLLGSLISLRVVSFRGKPRPQRPKASS